MSTLTTRRMTIEEYRRTHEDDRTELIEGVVVPKMTKNLRTRPARRRAGWRSSGPCRRAGTPARRRPSSCPGWSRSRSPTCR